MQRLSLHHFNQHEKRDLYFAQSSLSDSNRAIRNVALEEQFYGFPWNATLS